MSYKSNYLSYTISCEYNKLVKQSPETASEATKAGCR